MNKKKPFRPFLLFFLCGSAALRGNILAAEYGYVPGCMEGDPELVGAAEPGALGQWLEFGGWGTLVMAVAVVAGGLLMWSRLKKEVADA